MPINVQWEDDEGRVLAFLNDGFLTVHDLRRAPPDGACLRFIDPYGDTLFNQHQVEEVLREFSLLVEGASDDLTRARIRRVVVFIEEKNEGVHTYLRFVGD